MIKTSLKKSNLFALNHILLGSLFINFFEKLVY